MAQKISTARAKEVNGARTGDPMFKPVAIPAVIAAMQMKKAPQTRAYELPAILRKEAQIG
jgi:hypothetical protein